MPTLPLWAGPGTPLERELSFITDLYYKRDTCRLCGSANVEMAVPLNPIPIATPNFHIPGSDCDAPVYREAVPLKLYFCHDCGLSQVLHVGNPDLQYGNYAYTTSLSLGLPEHFVEYAKAVLAVRKPEKDSLIVEFGSNDGTLLRCFKQEGMRVVGIDPAKAIAEAATKSGIETCNAFFSPDLAETIKNAHGPASVLIANNVIANIDDLDPVALGVKMLMAPDGIFVFETQYGADVIRDMLLDTVYHEHLSYFNVKPLARFFKRHGMRVIDVEHIWTKGGSIRVTVQHADGPSQVSDAVTRIIAEEDAQGMNDLSCYRSFAGRVAALREKLIAIADEQHAAGRTVGGYGMSVGTTTLLAQFGLADKIDFLFDDDPNKESHLSGPGYDIPVMGPDGVFEKNPGLIVIFAWRYAEPIMAKHGKYLEQGGKFVIPLPEISVV